MYDNKLHLYNGLTEVPNPKEILNSVLGAYLGYIVGDTIGYTYNGRNAHRGNLPTPIYQGGGPEELMPGQVSSQVKTVLSLSLKASDPSSCFGEKVKSVLYPDSKDSPSTIMEQRYAQGLVQQRKPQADVLAMVLPCVVMGRLDLATTLARMVQNSPITDAVVSDWGMLMRWAILENQVVNTEYFTGGRVIELQRNSNNLISVFNNVVILASYRLSFYRTMELICRRGGAVSITAGLTGSVLGAMMGAKFIPKEALKGLEEGIGNQALEVASQVSRAITGHTPC